MDPHPDSPSPASEEGKAQAAAKAAKLKAEKLEAARLEAELITNVRQLTFEGRRAGEGYFSADGRRMVFQSERDPANPFYQIYVTDLETGDIEKVSPGTGKTTCAWIHPQGDRILFASTHEDPTSVEKQKEELALRESGKERRYAWDYDDSYEIYERRADGSLPATHQRQGLRRGRQLQPRRNADCVSRPIVPRTQVK